MVSVSYKVSTLYIRALLGLRVLLFQIRSLTKTECVDTILGKLFTENLNACVSSSADDTTVVPTVTLIL